MSDYEYKVTAIVLVYNGEPYLNNCLESLVNQTLDSLEILLINDASTDDSLSICRKYERDYDFVKVVDKDKNEGLATSANLGIELAKGEYVILVDNDDIVPPEAYEKLYTKAKETDSDICVGKANFIIGKYQQDMNFYDHAPWLEERTINDVNEFPIIFHDAFYWNKIIRKELLMKHNVRLPIGMIYADRNYSHAAYTYANKISIIPDCVYLWRRRENSLSMKREELSNYINRLDSYDLNLDLIINSYPDYIKVLLRRIALPIYGMLNNAEFEEFVFTRVYNLLKRTYDKVDDFYNNNADDIYNIFAYLILNNNREELKRLLQLRLPNEAEVFNENGKSYWKLPSFRDSNANIPDELFEINFLQRQFVKIKEIKTTKDSIIFKEIEIPKYFNLDEGSVVFKGRTKPDACFEDNCLSFDLEKIEDENRNIYNATIPINDLNIFEVYDIYLKSKSGSRIENEFRISMNNIDNVVNKSKNIRITYTGANNLVISNEQLKNQFKIECDKDELKVLVKNGNSIKKNLKLYLIKDVTQERFQLDLNEERTAYMINWKYFLDKKSVYSLCLTGFDKKARIKNNFNLTTKYIGKFENISFKTGIGIPVEIYKSGKNIKLKSN